VIITGIKVIPGDSSVAIGVAPGQPVELTYGQKLHIDARFDYQGTINTVTLYGAIGKRSLTGFNEMVASENIVPLPESPLPTPVNTMVEIPITADISPGGPYDLYVKLKEYPGVGMPQVDNVITITGIPPTFTLLEETIYPYAYVYDGPCEQFTFTFKTDPFTPADWIVGRLAAYCEDEIKKQGGRVMEMRVYVDKSPLLWTDWRIEIIGIPPTATAGTAMPLGIAWWVAFIIVVIGLIALIIITYNFIIKPLTYQHKLDIEEAKKTWSHQSLIGVIGDFEAKLIAEKKLPGPPTPPEELDKKTDQELRDYCDELANMIKPPVAGGAGLALAAVGVLGLGALAVAAMAMRKPEESRK